MRPIKPVSWFLPLLLAGCTPAPGAGGGVVHDGGDDGGSEKAPLVCGPLPAGVSSGHTGADVDTVAAPRRALVLMGGGPEVDDAMREVVESANGGDVLVLRASGSTESYLSYLAGDLAAAPPPSSVSVLRTDDGEAGAHEAVTCRVDASEAVWLAGGDQAAYLLGWPGPLHDRLRSTSVRGASIGGTSAGAMSLGAWAFDAALGSVTSAEALSDPTQALVSVSASGFGQPELASFLVDTHFSQRDREGRLLAFLAHTRARHGLESALGLGLDEEVALVVAENEAEVHAPFGGGAWLYRFEGEAVLTAGAALEMDIVKRVYLAHGERIPWPPVFSSLETIELTVIGGVIEAL